VTSYARNSQLAAYQSVSVHGAVDGADPHRMVLMLLDAIMERLAKARGCMERREVVQKTRLLHSCVVLVAELRGSLNLTEGGEIARNLDSLYDYIVRRLLLANLSGDAAIVEEVANLMAEIRTGWIAIGPAVRKVDLQAIPNAMTAPLTR
jgi:flagellar secretion chaperone FliS